DVHGDGGLALIGAALVGVAGLTGLVRLLGDGLGGARDGAGLAGVAGLARVARLVGGLVHLLGDGLGLGSLGSAAGAALGEGCSPATEDDGGGGGGHSGQRLSSSVPGGWPGVMGPGGARLACSRAWRPRGR